MPLLDRWLASRPRNRRIWQWLPLAATLCLLTACGPDPRLQALEAENQRLSNALDGERAGRRALADRFANLAADHRAQARELETLQKTFGAQQARNHRLEDDKQQLTQRLAEAQELRERLRIQLDSLAKQQIANQESLDTMARARDTVQGELSALHALHDQLFAELDALRGRLDQRDRALQEADGEIIRLEAKLRTLAKPLPEKEGRRQVSSTGP